MKIGIIGAGHAGVKAAETIQAAGHQAVLYSNERTAPYYRPKIIAYAFHQAGLDDLLIHPADWYAGHRIDLRLEQPVISFDPEAGLIRTACREEHFDAVILTAGAGPFIPPVTQKPSERVLPLWSEADARRIAVYAQKGIHMAVIGGGILGMEAALRAHAIGVRVTIIERLPRLLPMQFGAQASQKLLDVLRSRGIHVITAGVVSAITQYGDSLTIELDGRDSLHTDLTLMSVGARRNIQLPQQAGLRTDKGVLVDEYLHSSHSSVWAAGDIVQIPGLNRCSALDATMQGRIAAANALAVLTGGAPASYKPSDAAVNFKLNDFEIHSVGRVAGEGDREEAVDADDETCRIRVFDRNEKQVGVQMVGTGLDFKKWSAALDGV